MRSLNRLLFSLALIAATLVTGSSFAAEPHSWCVAGAPLIANGAPDTTTNTIIGNTCGNYPSCCSARWGLSCVQYAARYARDVQSAGDVCGRFAWAQGPLPGTGQFYPRDFNLFVVGGQASGLRDTDGPVAARDATLLNSFHVNVKGLEPIALLSGGSAFLSSGTVNGSALYQTAYSDSRVTYVDASRPSAPSRPFPIDFAATGSKLIAMSLAFKKYDAIPAVKQFSTVMFTGTDPELNVFSLPSTLLTDTTSYAFNVPFGSNIIVNVTGTNPSFANAGFSGSFTSSLMLWNFPDATSLAMSGMAFPGSVLAPNATANFRNGSIDGTVVLASAQPADVELYAEYYHVPSSVGARAVDIDPTWSFTGAISDDKTAADFVPEAGFLELGGGPYVAEGQARTSPTHRVWYSFVPSPYQPKKKPLAVFFNGGPGSATSSILFSFNTGPWTLDPTIAGTQKIVGTNSGANWSNFANLLYIDAPATGFSYPVASSDGTKPSIGIDNDRDAGYFNRLVLRFLKRHPEILNNRVLIVGESYGGVRATFMLDHMYNYQAIATTGNPYIDAQTYNEETDYFARVLGTASPTAQQIASKWGHQALISPVVAGGWQFKHFTQNTPNAFNPSVCLTPTCSNLIPGTGTGTLPSCDTYNCDKPDGWSDSLETIASTNLVVVGILTKAVAANVKNIEWLKASSRTLAYGRSQGDVIPAPDMTNVFGTLGPDDNYFMSFNDAVGDGYPDAGDWSADSPSLVSATDFSNQLHNGVTTFITATKFDLVVYAPEIPYAIAHLASSNASLKNLLKGGVSYDRNAQNNLARPGMFWLKYSADGADVRGVTMPHFYNSGHSVSQRAPVELLTDVKQWYNLSSH